MRRLMLVCLTAWSSVANASGAFNNTLMMFAELPLQEERFCLEREYERLVGVDPAQFANAVWQSCLSERQNISNIGATPSIRAMLLLLSDEQRAGMVETYNRVVEH